MFVLPKEISSLTSFQVSKKKLGRVLEYYYDWAVNLLKIILWKMFLGQTRLSVECVPRKFNPCIKKKENKVRSDIE